MGFFDSIKKSLGGGDKASDSIKGPSAALKEAGIDPQGLDFRFSSDGTVTITGRVMDEERKSRIGEVVGAIPQVSAVDNRIEVGAPEPPPAPEPSPVEPSEPSPAVEASAPAVPGETPDAPEDDAQPEAGETVSSYTVQPGDSLWKIAEAHYGNGTKYQAIFEANRDILDNPDLIKPGQVLKLPRL